jgi:hypothetical protein
MSETLTHRQLTKPLNERGFHHYILPLLVFVVLFGICGAYFYITSHAAATYVELHIGSQNGSCVDGASIGGCTTSGSGAWQTLQGSNFAIKSQGNLCLDDWNGKVGTNAATRTYVHYYSCNGDRNQQWNWNNHRLVNVASGGCINGLGGSTSSGAQLIVFSCNSQSNEAFYESSISASTGGGGNSNAAGTPAALLNAAEHWRGVWYLYGGGHETYTAFHKACPTVSASNGSCEVDCSGLVSMATDMALGTNFSWYVDGNGVMQGSGASHWHEIAVSSVVPGDIVTASDHVEFVYGHVGSRISTFGAHETGTKDGFVAAGSTFAFTKAYRYE